ncbi:MAG: response regulator transcription factor, partial [Hyphomicrobiales bacterium]|nr:response regulator transcription factor [Hyphomicrobiales bacterium]
GYEVIEAENGEQVHSAIINHTVDLITLDLNLGSESGLTIASEIRATSHIPIIMVTGKGEVIDTVVGLEIGADDYISKPFHVREVQARVRSVIRRTGTNSAKLNRSIEAKDTSERGNVYQFDGWMVDSNNLKVRDRNGSLADLTTGDLQLLMVFLKNPKRVLSRDQLLDHLNGQEWTPYDRVIDNKVARLRKKLETNPAKPGIIKTVRGIGYLFSSDVEIV